MGAFNLTGPPMAISEMLGAIARAAGTTPSYHWASDEFVLARRRSRRASVLGSGGRVGLLAGRHRQGARARPHLPSLADTARDTLAWLRSRPVEARPASRLVRAGMSAEREAELLAA